MPIYEYRCNACNNRIERLQKINDPVLTTCPECGEEALTKLISAAGFQLKGSGWYATDFKGNGKNQPEKKQEASPPCQSGGDGVCPCATS